MAIDGNNLARRMYHIGESNPDETRALYAVFEFWSYMLRLNRDYAPARVILAWDEPPYFRSEMYPPYKANRSDVTGNWVTQLHFIRKVADEAGIISVSKPGLEADDVLATISKRSGNCLIISSDKDLLSLVSASTTLELLRWTKAEGTHRKRLSDRLSVKEFFGVFPEQVATFKALAGDASDNIPGVEGIGHKKAVYLLENYLTFQGIYDHVSDLRTSLGKPLKIAVSLVEQHEDAVLYKTICTPFVDEGMIIPEARPLSVKAVAEALNSVPDERR
jgi:DNA polymerase-1